jgi:hypothetical protein
LVEDDTPDAELTLRVLRKNGMGVPGCASIKAHPPIGR